MTWTTSRSKVLGVLAGVVAIAIACTPIETTQSTRSVVVSQRTWDRTPGAWQTVISVTARVAPDGGATVSGDVLRLRNCERVAQTVSDDTVTQERTPRTHLFGLTTAFGAIGAGAFAWGLAQHEQGKPLTRSGSDGSSDLTTVGAGVYIGGIFSLLLVDSLVTMVRCIDSSQTERHSSERVESVRCAMEPLADSAVVLSADQRAISEGRSDARGHFAISLPSGQLPASASDFTLTSSGSSVRVDALRGATLQLYGVRLHGATRAELEAAVARAGGRAFTPWAEHRSKNISEFDAPALDLPNPQRLKLLFDGEDQLVRAKYRLNLTRAERAIVLLRLRERYGESSQNSEQIPYFRKVDAMEISFRDEAPADPSNRGASLSFVDPVRDAALRDVVEKSEAGR